MVAISGYTNDIGFGYAMTEFPRVHLHPAVKYRIFVLQFCMNQDMCLLHCKIYLCPSSRTFGTVSCKAIFTVTELELEFMLQTRYTSKILFGACVKSAA